MGAAAAAGPRLRGSGSIFAAALGGGPRVAAAVEPAEGLARSRAAFLAALRARRNEARAPGPGRKGGLCENGGGLGEGGG